jgi:hypothetical protein
LVIILRLTDTLHIFLMIKGLVYGV